MTLEIRRLKTGGWEAFIRAGTRDIPVFMEDQAGQPDGAQVAIARRLAASLDKVTERAARYLDLFIDRPKACGSREEEWWLDEINLRDLPREAPFLCQMHFTLYGDGDGMWTVDLVVRDKEFRPIRFERLQG